MNINVNMLAILVAGISTMVVGFVWYSPMVLGKPWMKLMGITPESMKKAQKEMGKLYMISFMASLVTGYVIAHTMALSINFYGYSSLMTGITTAFFAWIGFVMPVQLTDVIFGSKKWQLFAINTGYQLASLLVMGIVIGLLG